jgi:hypothetical protein
VRLSRLFLVALSLVAAAVGATVVYAQVSKSGPPFGNVHHRFDTAVYLDRPEDSGPETSTVMSHVVASGATFVRFTMYWYEVAPSTRPAHWKPSNPADSHYDWSTYDREIKAAAARHLKILVTVLGAPAWAQTKPVDPPPGSDLPSPSALASFAKAAATRYSGHYHGLPRVRYWQVWDEPNLTPYLAPQLLNRKPVAVYNYRKLMNVFYAAVKRVARSNVVVAGGLAPFRDISGAAYSQNKDWGPLLFMRYLLCIGKDLKPTCSTRVHFDMWAQHPYTSGDPTHHAALPNDVSLGDIPKVNAILNAAVDAHHVVSTRGKPGFWVTEFSWDTNPPDTQAVPARLAARWVAQAQLVLWQDGVSEMTWLMLRDDAPGSFLQSGLYYRGSRVASDRRKPLFESFRFPVVALKKGGGADVWGRTPAGKREPVWLEQLVDGKWRTIKKVRPDGFGVFQTALGHVSGTSIRGRLASGETSNGFGVEPVPDRFFNPFGGNVALEPHASKTK